MEKKELLQLIDDKLSAHPEFSKQLEDLVNEHNALLYRQKMAATDPKIIIFLLKKEVVPKAGIPAKEKMALTLKKLCETPNGANRNLPHLKGLHIMTISSHFYSLCNRGLIEKVSYGMFKLSPKGWLFMERANSLQGAYNEVYDLL